jgi:hypothetical protein
MLRLCHIRDGAKSRVPGHLPVGLRSKIALLVHVAAFLQRGCEGFGKKLVARRCSEDAFPANGQTAPCLRRTVGGARLLAA